MILRTRITNLGSQPIVLIGGEVGGVCFDGALEDNVAKQDHPGVMIAYILPPEQQKALAMEGGEAPEEIHLTILYLGKDLTDEQIDTVKEKVWEIASKYAPLQGTVGGKGRFPAAVGTEGKDVIIRMVDVPRLEALREKIIEVLQAEGIEPVLNHGYTPHITLAYVDPDFEGACIHPDEMPLTIDALTVAVGEEQEEFPLNGQEVVKGKGNPCHEPGGSSKGGEFCSTASGGGAATAFGGFSSELTTTERDAMNVWVGGNSYSMDEIRAHERGETQSPLGAEFLSAMEKAPVAKGTVYRGLHGLDEDTMVGLVNGKVHVLDNLSSFSTKQKLAETFARKGTAQEEVFVVIKAKVSGTRIKDLTSANRYGEAEIVAPRGSRLRVTNTQELELDDRYGYLIEGVLE